VRNLAVSVGAHARLERCHTVVHGMQPRGEDLRVLVDQHLGLVDLIPVLALLASDAEELGALGGNTLVEGEEALGAALADEDLEGGVDDLALRDEDLGGVVVPMLVVSRWYYADRA
jgi:hypothetical protein